MTDNARQSSGRSSYRTHRFSHDELNRFEPGRNVPVQDNRDSDISQIGPGLRKRGRKSTKAIIADMASALQRADYALGRIRRLEEQIAQVLKDVGRDATTLVIAERPSLRQYLQKSN